jgi:hypothetical protein
MVGLLKGFGFGGEDDVDSFAGVTGVCGGFAASSDAGITGNELKPVRLGRGRSKGYHR